MQSSSVDNKNRAKLPENPINIMLSGQICLMINGSADMYQFILSLVLVIGLPMLAGAQRLPYTVVREMDDIANSITRVSGLKCDLEVENKREGDSRKFKIFLQSPSSRTEVKVGPDGTFRLPALPKEDWDQSYITHTLAPGALSMSVSISLDSSRFDGFDGSIYEMVSPIVKTCQNMSSIRPKLEEFGAPIGDPEIAIVGLSFTRVAPVSGKLHLMRGDQTVASIDLSQTGTVSWLFEEYDPRKHRIRCEMAEGVKPQMKEGVDLAQVHLILKKGTAGTVMPHAVYIWKVEADSAANGRQQIRSETNATSSAAGSRR